MSHEPPDPFADDLRSRLATATAEANGYAQQAAALRRERDEARAATERVAASFMKGERDCQGCGRVTANVKCAACMRGDVTVASLITRAERAEAARDTLADELATERLAHETAQDELAAARAFGDRECAARMQAQADAAQARKETADILEEMKALSHGYRTARAQARDAEQARDRACAREMVLREALATLHALVHGERPSLLEDDHHDDIVRAALANTDAGATRWLERVRREAELKEAHRATRCWTEALGGTYDPNRIPGITHTLAEHDAKLKAQWDADFEKAWDDQHPLTDDDKAAEADVAAEQAEHDAKVRAAALEAAADLAEDWTCKRCDSDTAGDLAMAIRALATQRAAKPETPRAEAVCATCKACGGDPKALGWLRCELCGAGRAPGDGERA